MAMREHREMRLDVVRGSAKRGEAGGNAGRMALELAHQPVVERHDCRLARYSCEQRRDLLDQPGIMARRRPSAR